MITAISEPVQRQNNDSLVFYILNKQVKTSLSLFYVGGAFFLILLYSIYFLILSFFKLYFNLF